MLDKTTFLDVLNQQQSRYLKNMVFSTMDGAFTYK